MAKLKEPSPALPERFGPVVNPAESGLSGSNISDPRALPPDTRRILPLYVPPEIRKLFEPAPDVECAGPVLNVMLPGS